MFSRESKSKTKGKYTKGKGQDDIYGRYSSPGYRGRVKEIVREEDHIKSKEEEKDTDTRASRRKKE
eukprot:1486973-Amphidinium_carterae.1